MSDRFDQAGNCAQLFVTSDQRHIEPGAQGNASARPGDRILTSDPRDIQRLITAAGTVVATIRC